MGPFTVACPITLHSQPEPSQTALEGTPCHPALSYTDHAIKLVARNSERFQTQGDGPRANSLLKHTIHTELESQQNDSDNDVLISQRYSDLYFMMLDA